MVGGGVFGEGFLIGKVVVVVDGFLGGGGGEGDVVGGVVDCGVVLVVEVFEFVGLVVVEGVVEVGEVLEGVEFGVGDFGEGVEEGVVDVVEEEDGERLGSG